MSSQNGTMEARPWSPAEVEEKLQLAISRLHDEVANLRGMGVSSARAEWHYREALARCTVAAEGRNAEERHANAILALCEMRSTMPGWEQLHPGVARDLARNAYADARTVVAAVSDDIGAMRSMLKSARGGQG